MKRTKRKLALSTESIRNLDRHEITIAAAGCPTGSWPTVGVACTTAAADSAAC